jgi:hypothetical protein
MIRPNDLLLDPKGDIVEQLNTDSQQIINDLVVSLGITSSTESVKESLKADNSITLANGLYGGWFSSKDGSVYKGMGASTKVTRLVEIKADCIIDGIHFVGDDIEWLVFINIGSTVVFRNCIFEKRGGNEGAYIALAAPGTGGVVAKANFIGCVFQGPNTGILFLNPGPAANVNTIGCYDKTGIGFAGTTGVGNL